MENFYGSEYKILVAMLNKIIEELDSLPYIEHICGRIKQPDSAISKLNKKGLPLTSAEAQRSLNDILGVRTVARFIDDAYKIYAYIASRYDILAIKDYIKNPKPNGYRSLHLIIKVPYGEESKPIEVQIRTISQDAWASLEHKMKYKKEVKHIELITSELKRCADELASIDISMQAIDDMIKEASEKDS